jgi:pre-mRNA-splicing factor ISY1
MARNEEKAQAMLNRFLAGKAEEARGPKEKRPYLATECHDLNEADRWRQQILREIGRKVMEIQNAGLGDHRCQFVSFCRQLQNCTALSGAPKPCILQNT